MQLKVKVDKAGPCRKTLHVEVPAEEVSKTFVNVTGSITKIARVPGFRKGKAPQKVVESHFKKEIEDEVKDRLLGLSYREAVAQENIEPVNVLAIDDLFVERDQPMTYKVQMDVEPEFKLPKYKGLALKEKKNEVTDEDVEKRVKSVLEHFARYEDTDREVRDGDMALVDFKGVCEGKPLEEIAPSAKGIGEAKDFWVTVTENGFLPGFDKGLAGAVKGDTREINVAFPDAIKIKELAGKAADYTVTVKNVREKVLPAIDEEFLKQVEFKSEDDFRAKIRETLDAEAEADAKSRLKDEVVKTLLSKTSMDLPETLVQEETLSLLLDLVRHNVQRGVSREELDKHSAELKTEAAKNAAEKIKMRYILQKIAEEESVSVEEKEVDDFIAGLARARHKTEPELREEIEKNESMDSIRLQLKIDKTLDFIIEQAKSGKEGFLDKIKG